MNILIDILHPAHVHFFKPFLSQAVSRGHHIHVVTRNKDITNDLLDKAGIAYETLSVPATTRIGLLLELLLRWWKVFVIIKCHKIDLSMSITGLSTALPAWLLRIPNINFMDTEDAKITNILSFPFSDIVCTPTFYLTDIGRKHVRYFGLHELSYLKYYNYGKLADRLVSYGLPKKYIIIRLVAKNALHDFGIKGIPLAKLEELILRMENYGTVFLNSETILPEHLEKYRLFVPIEHIHDVLAGALIFIGESPTMAVESSLLGTPAYLVSSRWQKLGNMVHLEKDFHLLNNFSDYKELFEALDKIYDPEETKREWARRAEEFRDRSDDVTKTIEMMIERSFSNNGNEYVYK